MQNKILKRLGLGIENATEVATAPATIPASATEPLEAVSDTSSATATLPSQTTELPVESTTATATDAPLSTTEQTTELQATAVSSTAAEATNIVSTATVITKPVGGGGLDAVPTQPHLDGDALADGTALQGDLVLATSTNYGTSGDVNPETEAVLLAASTESDTIETPTNTSCTCCEGETECKLKVSDLPAAVAPDVAAPAIVDTIAEDTLAPAVDTEIEYLEAENEMESASDAVDTLYATATALEEIAGLQPELVNGTDEIAVINIAIQSAVAPLNDDTYSESVSIEGIGDRVKEIWKAVMAAIKAFIAKVAKFIMSGKNRNKQNSDKLDKAKEKLKTAEGVRVNYSAGEVSVGMRDSVLHVTTPFEILTPSSLGLSFLSLQISLFDVNLHKTKNEVMTILDMVDSKLERLKRVEESERDNALVEFKTYPTVNTLKMLQNTLREDEFKEKLDKKTSNGSDTESGLVKNLKSLENIISSADKSAGEMETFFALADKATGKLLEAGSSTNSSEAMSFIRGHVVGPILKAEQVLVSQYAEIQKAINYQSNIATMIVGAVGRTASKEA